MSDERGTHTNGARFLVTRVFGLLAAAAAAEQEPALTLLPNLVAAGVLTLLLDLAFGTGDAALVPVIVAAFILFPLCVLSSRAADAVPSRRDMSRPLWKEPR